MNSGTTYAGGSSALYDNNETLVTSGAQVSSGNGFYYCNLTLPNTRQWLVNEQRFTDGVNTYAAYQLIHVRRPEV